MSTQTIKQKIIQLNLSVSLLAVVLSLVLIGFSEWFVYKKMLVSELLSMAQVIAMNSRASLVSGEIKTGRQILSALKAKKNITSAKIYHRNKSVFVSFDYGQADRIPLPENWPLNQPLYFFKSGKLHIFCPIGLNRENVGVVYVQSNLTMLYEWLQSYFYSAGLVLLLAMGVVVVFSNRLQQTISLPLVALTDIVRRITETKDYTLRAEKESQDEMGLLVEGYNAMLAQIQSLISDLRNARIYSERIVATIPTAVAALDEGYRIVSYNPAFNDLTQQTNILGQKLYDILPVTRLRHIIENESSQKEAKIHEITIPGYGETDDLHMTISFVNFKPIPQQDSPVVSSTGEMSSAKKLAVFVNITERIHLMHELKDNLAMLKQAQSRLVQSGKMAAVGELAAGVAHEINNPLTAVLSHSMLLQEKFKRISVTQQQIIPKFEWQLKQIIMGAKRCQDIAKDLLTFSRQDQSEKTMVYMQDVIDGAINLIGDSQFQRKQVRLVEEINTKLAILGNINQLQQLLINLVLNALQAMEGGEIILIFQAGKAGMAELMVMDNGPGIPKEDLEKIFDPFFTTKPAGEGTGLGLSIVYGIIHDHNGNIVVKSEIGQGTLFAVTLPLYQKSNLEE